MRKQRRGAATVEMAIVAPVFLTILFAITEFGHAYLAMNLLNGAADKAARVGITDGVDSATVLATAQSVVAAAMPASSVSVQIKNADPFDDIDGNSNFNPGDIDYDDLSDIELADSESRQLFLVRLEVDYDDIGMAAPYFLKGLKLNGQAVMRRE